MRTWRSVWVGVIVAWAAFLAVVFILDRLEGHKRDNLDYIAILVILLGVFIQRDGQGAAQEAGRPAAAL